MNDIWFRKSAYYIWVPITWQGWLIAAGYLSVLIYNFFMVSSHARSVGSTILNFLPIFILSTIIVAYIANETSEQQ